MYYPFLFLHPWLRISGAIAAVHLVPGVTHPGSASALVVSKLEPHLCLAASKGILRSEEKLLKTLKGPLHLGWMTVYTGDKFTVIFYYPYQRKTKKI
jgi:hypothetical protein